MSNSVPTPIVARGVMREAHTMTFREGRLAAEVTIAAGTKCEQLDGGTDAWVVTDLKGVTGSFDEHYAEVHGIRVPPDLITDIVDVPKEVTDAMRRRQQRAMAT